MKTQATGIAVDGETRGNPGPSKYRGVDLATYSTIFIVDIGIATNNIAEFCALGHAIFYCIKHGISTTIYSDSQTAISWIRKKKANSKLPASPKTERARDFVERIENALKDVSIEFDGVDITVNNDIVVSKWYTSEWGEIPADFGNK
ncbi:MAG: ribonuclease H [Bacteroidales bacterium]|nr:ribonuclease H [Bacteroidales bacterium]